MIPEPSSVDFAILSAEKKLEILKERQKAKTGQDPLATLEALRSPGPEPTERRRWFYHDDKAALRRWGRHKMLAYSSTQVDVASESVIGLSVNLEVQ